MVTIKLSNKLHYSLITIAAILLIGVGVYAYGGTTPSTMGHSIGEIAPPSGCSAGQVLRMVPAGVGWDCVNVVSSIPSTYVRNVETVSFTRSGCTGNSAYIACPSGKSIIGGGCGGQLAPPVSASYPYSLGWQCYFEYDGSGHDCTAYAICANIS